MGITAASELCYLDRNMPRRAVRTPITVSYRDKFLHKLNLVIHRQISSSCNETDLAVVWDYLVWNELITKNSLDKGFSFPIKKSWFFFCIEANVWIFQRKIVWKWLWSCSAWLNCLAMFWVSAICLMCPFCAQQPWVQAEKMAT